MPIKLRKNNNFDKSSNQKNFVNGKTGITDIELPIGTPENDVPEKLQKMFPMQKFYYPRNLPGIYAIYFTEFNKVYVGESDNVRKRLARETQSFDITASTATNLYLKMSNFNIKTYALYQSPTCNVIKRKLLEKKFIAQAGENALNIQKNVNKTFANILKTPNALNFSLKEIPANESWQDYDLPYQQTKYNPGDTIIYAILNKNSKRLYIGQTTLCPITNRMRLHKNSLEKILALKLKGITTKMSANTRMADDIEEGATNFIYSGIKNLCPRFSYI